MVLDIKFSYTYDFRRIFSFGINKDYQKEKVLAKYLIESALLIIPITYQTRNDRLRNAQPTERC